MSYKFKFVRFEHKYLIPFHLANDLMLFFSRRCVLDPNNKGGSPYKVLSLYFDSLDFLFYKEKIGGYPDRRKVRIRFYEELHEKLSPLFLEIKNKEWDRIYKERSLITLAQFKRVVCGEKFFGSKECCTDVFRKFVFLNHLHNLAPVSFVRYNRLSYLDPLVDFKVSFDSDIYAAMPTNLYDPQYKSVLDTSVIMELKFEKHLPTYAVDAVKKYNLRRDALSKYCHSIERLYRY